MDFELPDDDIGFLNNSFDVWQTIISNVERGIIIKNYSLPDGYNCQQVEMMILVPQNYPAAALDMFYISPDIIKTNGRSIGALSSGAHFDRQWQRWSRHYQWQAGIHNIATHLHAVKNALEDELRK